MNQSDATSLATSHVTYNFGNSFRRGRCGEGRLFSTGMQDTRPWIEHRHPSVNEFANISGGYNQIFQCSNRGNEKVR